VFRIKIFNKWGVFMANTKILIVDDDLNISELLRLCLEKEGYDTIIANDGLSAISMFKSKHRIWFCSTS